MKISRRQFLTTAFLTGVSTAVALPIYTTRIEPHWIQFEHHTLPVRNLPPHLQGKTLIQLSDLHIGRAVDNDYLRTVFLQVKELNPDFVVYTGDFVSYKDASQVVQMGDVMAAAPLGRLGTTGVLGNHDYGYGWQQEAVGLAVMRKLKDLGIDILRNERRTYAGLDVVGVDELWFPAFDSADVQAAFQDSTRPTVALCHNPDGADYDMWGSYDGWILSGHTHGGQCKPPFLPAPLVPVNNRTYTAGLFPVHENGRSLYINRGVGHANLKVRFNARPEVTVFTLQDKAEVL